MMIHSLALLSPLYYFQDESDPFDIKDDAGGNSTGEKLFCFDLDEAQCLSFEPDKDKLLGGLVFSGVSTLEPEAGRSPKTQLELPRGNYLFAQERGILSRDGIISLTVEIQLQGLWQRLLPLKRLYLRYLYEDGSWVTQLFRPFRA